MSDLPRVTFGMIVLNGEPFTRYNLRALYPFAHQIIVVEGASPFAAEMATPDGHSKDGTLEILSHFKANEDPENKITLVTAEDEGHPNGFWPGEKDEQSQAYAKRATGNWLWQVDVDEFYSPADMHRICEYLLSYPETICLSFNDYYFWGGFDYVVNGGIHMSIRFQGEPNGAYRRIFKWGCGYHYKTHRPPTVCDSFGKDISRNRVTNITKSIRARMYHYSMVFPFQIIGKSVYYERRGHSFARGISAQNNLLVREVNIKNGLKISNQFGTFNWLERFDGNHPPAILTLQEDLLGGKYQIETRRSDDIELLLSDPDYQKKIRLFRPLEKTRSYWHLVHYICWTPVRRFVVRLVRWLYPFLKWLPFPLRIRMRIANGN